MNNDGEEPVAGNVEVVESVPINNDQELLKKDKKFEQYFQLELENVTCFTLLHIEPRQKLPEVKLSDKVQERANKILRLYLPSADTMPEITNIAHAMGKAIGYATGIKPKKGNENRTKNVEGGNRREWKLEAGMKKLREDVARVGNELCRRKQQKIHQKIEKDHERTWNKNEW